VQWLTGMAQGDEPRISRVRLPWVHIQRRHPTRAKTRTCRNCRGPDTN